MKIIFLTVSAILTIGVIGVLFFRRKREVESNDSEIAPQPEEPSLDAKVVLDESLKRTEQVQETAEEMAKRLEKLSSSDKDKPFAKMSKPTVAEVPNEMLSEKSEPILEGTDESAKPKPKKKRPYKKKTTPKKPTE